ncbi:L,D-transpeptidase family protein [Parasediminibacterium sp. JCM 36343]|uniref:L,D-transpeptidase family protein n=1 Tax=Parasediminibacterium sp. JCM 36343 TaxID=3374279 RepID=UPI003979F472
MFQRFSCLLLVLVLVVCTSFKRPAKKDGYYIVIDKSDYNLMVYDADNNWQVTYPCVFGNNDQGDKLTEGDRRTPEGTFHIVVKKPHPKWDSYLGLDYPREEDIQKFNERKAKGIIPANGKLGGAIGIHGTWPHEDFAIDQFQNWTQGCISTKNEYMDELFKMIPIGTRVIIQK